VSGWSSSSGGRGGGSRRARPKGQRKQQRREQRDKAQAKTMEAGEAESPRAAKLRATGRHGQNERDCAEGQWRERARGGVDGGGKKNYINGLRHCCNTYVTCRPRNLLSRSG
jgi:hypothetical protein